MTRVAIVEDHPMVRDGLAKLLETTGRFQVAGAVGTVKEALALVHASTPDVMVADLSLQDGNAIDILRALSRDGRRVRTLIITAYRDDFSVAEALQAGALGYVLKQQPTSEILAAIEQVTCGKTYLPAALAHRLRDHGAGAKDGNPLKRLTEREREIFQLVVRGGMTRGIARDLGVSVKTVDTHRTNINRKLGVRTTAALIRFAAAHGVNIGK
jgi:DNA-binding NarL/FixJ family response regulator